MRDLERLTPPRRLFRVGRAPDPWAWPPWEFAGQDGTFGNRWDDRQGNYRVLYASSRLEGCFLETLSRFRPDPHVLAELAAIKGPEATSPPGVLPRSWLEARVIGEASVFGTFANVGSAASLAYLHKRLASRLVHYGIGELDGAAIRRTAPRAFTQEISSHIYARADARGRPLFSGIAYLSRFGDDYQNWAIFERLAGVPAIERPTVRDIDVDGRELRAALALLGLRLGD